MTESAAKCVLSQKPLGFLVPGWCPLGGGEDEDFGTAEFRVIIRLLDTGDSNGYIGKQQIWYFYFLSKLKAVLIQKRGKLKVGPD